MSACDLAVDQAVEATSKIEGRHQEMFRLRLGNLTGQESEHLVHVIGDALVVGEHPMVGVNTCRLLVEVSGPHVGVEATLLSLSPGN